ncbi:flavin-binding monooxygenase-like protein [Pleurostoma richardsiae]|uniref:Flavin-binding monooxygenase-like protein n=1 Tax=Pleurostoma richardsiae TaxID=41990 RepID=A0AA38VEL7_9PEZI|nr:flavin-binding monooxygenase-like protein [Pleurostoma richardsiae]
MGQNTLDSTLPHGFNTDGIDLPYHTNSEGYVVPDVTYKSSENRRMRVVTVGAGYSGILLAYRIQKELENVEHVIYEKNGEVGGAWLENRYPNCACDVPSHSYVYPFALNPEWPEFHSKSEDIWCYLDRVCRVFGLRKYMKFNHRVAEAVWDEVAGKWNLKVEKVFIDGSIEIIEDTCDVLLQAAGLLNNPILPKIDGLQDFKGRVVHTAQWPSSFGKEQWKGLKVVVLGAGSSAVQTVPGMQPYVDELHVFVRSKTWLASTTPEPAIASSEKMRHYLGREDLTQGFIPNFSYGCRRVSPGVNFMKAVGQPNVKCYFTPVTRITAHSVIGLDGTEVQCDAIVFATGFDTTFRPHYKIIGQHGVSLAEKWKDVPEGYLGVGCPGFPNFLMFFGPAWPVFAGSVTASLTAVSTLALAMIRKIQTDDIKSIAPKQEVTDAFNIHQQAMLHGTVWEDDCSSWYKDKNGRINAIWPGSGLHFQEVVSEPRWEDYNITYKNQHNMWAFLGRGFTRLERDPDADVAPYMSVDALDPAWFDESIPWRPPVVHNKESARLATAEEPPQHIKAGPDEKTAALDVTGPDGSRFDVFAGATLVDNEEIGQRVKSQKVLVTR